MKRAKDDDKFMRPMFPRLHVKDTDKGGPKAPPRNKMALYEQLSIPSQRFSHSVVRSHNSAPNSMPPSSQRGDNGRSMFISHQTAPGHQTEKQYSRYFDMSIPSVQVEQTRKLDEDDYRVPILTGPDQEYNKIGNDMDGGRLLFSNLPYSNQPLKFQEAKETEHSKRDGRNESAENSKDFVGGRNKAISGSSPKMDVPGSNHSNSLGRSKAGSDVRTETFAASQHSIVKSVEKRNSFCADKDSPLENQISVHDHIDDTESREDGVYRSLQNGILESGDCVSETSILDSLSGHDITADDVVAIIGQKHFWKARKAIVNQQRVFAVQVFELHRLIKVQKLIAASPHLLLEDAAYLGKALKSLPGKKPPLDYDPIKALPTIPKQKVNSEKTSQKKEVSAENSIEKASLSSAQNGTIPTSHRPLNSNNLPTPSLNNDPNGRPWYLNQSQSHQWLIPVMSPSEGLVYKPYPAPGSANEDCSGYGPPGSIHMMGNFRSPVYGIPAQPHQYQFPTYFPPYGMPVMNSAAISGMSVDQVNLQATLNHVLKEPNYSNQTNPRAPSNVPTQRNEGFQDSCNRPMDIEVQASTASSPSVRQQVSKRANSSMEARNVLPLFPTSPMNNSNSRDQIQEQPERPSRVIKVVPHNPTSVSESVARIIRSIEEERRQFDST